MLKQYLVFRDPGAPVSTSGPAPKQTGGDQNMAKPPVAAKAPPKPPRGQATAEQIEAWKKQYPLGIYFIEVDGQIGYFKEPSRQEINCALYMATSDSPLSANEELGKLTLIPGQDNMKILEDDSVYSTVMAGLGMRLNGTPGRIVKL